MPRFTDNFRVKNLNTIFHESGCKSVSAFAARIGVAQSSTRNYIVGERLPDMDFISKVIDTFPEYNLRWLSADEQPKYNKQIVDIDPNGHLPEQDDPIKSTVMKLYEDLIASMKREIEHLTEICKSKNEQIKLLQSMVEEKDK